MINNACCLVSCHHNCDPVPSCIRYLKVQTTVVSGTVSATITDKFGHSYAFAVETDTEGMALLDLEASYLPEGLLNAYGGDYDLKVAGMHFPANNAFYECLRFNVANSYAVAGNEPTEGDPTTYPTYTIPYVFEAD